FLSYVGEDLHREGLLGTPKRVRKAFEFLCSGYNQDPKELIQKALFTSANDELDVV
ncbi:GTP cyclohydrolase I, partial [Aliarcobacter butzleri]